MERQRERGAASNSIIPLATDSLMELRPMNGEEEQEESECSSGCRSGWTAYFDQSYENYPTTPLKKATYWHEEEGEEDLSMISDASSGPPHYHEQADEQCCDDDGRCFCYSSAPPAALAENASKRRRVESGKQQTTEQEVPPSNLLDDDASSPVFSYSKTATTINKMIPNVEDVLEFSYGFSATHSKGKSVLQKHLGRLQSTSPAKPTSAIPVCSDGGDKKTCDAIPTITTTTRLF